MDIDFGSDVGNALATRMLLTDANLQAVHPNWPTGGTAAQIGIESNGNNDAVSPKGATGIAQFEPATFDAVKKQMGRPGMDIHNVQDQLDAHQYLMMQNLNRTGGDVDTANSLYNSGKADANNPETNNYVSQFRKRTGMDSPNQGATTPQVPAQSGQIDFGDSQPKQPEIDFGDGGQPGALMQAGNWLGDKASALGQVAAQMGTGTFGLAAGALHGGVDLLQGKSYEEAHKDLQKEQEAVTYQPRTASGQALSGAVNSVMTPITNALEQGGQTAVGAIPFIGEELQKQGYAKPISEIGTSLAMNLGLPAALHGVGGAVFKGRGAPLESAAKLAPEAPDEAAAPSAAMPEQAPPEAPAMQVSPSGVVDTGVGDANQVAALQMHQAGIDLVKQQAMELQYPESAGDLFPETHTDTTGQASPWGQVERDQALAEQPGGRPLTDTELQRGGFTPPESPQGALNFERPTGREIQARIQTADPRAIDPESDTPHPQQEAPAARSLAPDEFTQAVTALAERDPTKFSMPADMGDAYDRYTKMVRDEDGNVLSKSATAKKFADAVTQEILSQRLADHPVIKANQARVDNLQAKLDAAKAKQGPTSGIQAALDTASKTLAKSQDNLSAYFKETAKQQAPWERDGIVNMNTFGHLPTLMKSIGAILKGIHGVVFKTLDRAARNFGNLDSTGKIFGQGIKNYIHEQATRDWSQTVNQKPIEQLSKVAGIRKAVNEMNPFAQESLSPEELKAQFNTAPDLGGGMVSNFLRNNFLPGGLMISDFSQHPLVKYVTDQVANGQRSAAKWVRSNLLDPKTGLRSMYKKLSSNAMTEMWTLKEAYEGTKEFTAAELKHRGYSDEQAAAYARTNELQKEAFSNYNEARVRAGEAPMDPRIAHIASYFTGDFRIQVKDAEGRMIASIGHNTKFGVQTIAQRFKELHPDGENLQFGKPTLNRMQGGSDASFHGFMNILQELSKTNADVGRLVQSYRDTQMANTMKLSQMMNRGKFKSQAQNTVGGAEGSKLWQSMEKNAQDGVKQQFKYLESMAKWTELQKAVDNGTKFIDDPEVNAPNAKAVSQAYLNNQMHRNLGALNDFTNSFMSGVAEVTGVGPTAMRSLAAGTKTGLLNMFVGLINFKHSMVTFSQPIWGIPPVNAVMQARGAAFGKAQVLSVFKSLMSNKDILQGMVTKQPIKDSFVNAANEFAKNNDTFNTSQFQMGSVSKPATKLGTAMHINVTVPESGARAFSYMYYVHMLKDTVGDAMTDREIFGTAHNATQKVMGDYGQEAQAAIYNKMGFLGGLTKMLTTFKMNQVGQFATASKMFSHGQITPMVATLASSLAAAGLRGFIGYNIANAALGQLTTWAAKNGVMEQPTNLDQIVLHSLHGMNKGLADALNFGAMSGLGVDMTGSLSHADDLPMDPIGTLMPEGNPITKMIGSAFKVAQQPNSANAKAAIYDLAPNSAKGALEKAWYTDNEGHYYDPHTGAQVSQRTPLDQGKRMLGFRPLEESKLKLEANVAQGHEQQLAAVRNNITNRVLREADSNNGAVPNMTEYSQRYEAAGGNTNTLVAELAKHNGPDKALNIQQRQQGMATGDYTNAEKYVRSQGFKQP